METKIFRVIYPRDISSTRRLLASYLVRYQRKEINSEELRNICYACSKLKEIDELIEVKRELDLVKDEVERLAV